MIIGLRLSDRLSRACCVVCFITSFAPQQSHPSLGLPSRVWARCVSEKERICTLQAAQRSSMGSEKNHFNQQEFEVRSRKEGKVQKTEGIGWLRLRGGGVHSLYEILGVGEKASAQEIRTAYRRAALHIHPDKNLDSPEEAAIKFRKLQHAYEVLGNPSSRASYDSYSRSSYAYSGTRHVEGEEQDSAGNVEEEEHLDLSRFFVAAAYSGYHEGRGGFYCVYSGIFECISALEAVCVDARASAGRSEARRGGASGDSRLPCFGQAGSSYQEVGVGRKDLKNKLAYCLFKTSLRPICS